MASQALIAWISSLEQISPAFADFIRNITIPDKAVAQKDSLTVLDKGAALLADYSAVSYTSIAAAVLGIFYFLFSMTSYSRRGYSPLGGRRSPYNASSAPGQIREGDFEYVEADAHTLASRRSRHDLRYASQQPRHADDDENAPDIIILRHLNANYPLLFKPYAISDGLVTIGDIRHFGAEHLGHVDPRRVKLLYKGKQLKDDHRTAKAEGLKQQSEIMVVVSEAAESTSRNNSDEDAYSSLGSDTGRKKKSSSSKPAKEPVRVGNAPPKVPSRAPSPQDLNDPQAKVSHLATLYATQWAPVCREYLSYPPTDAKTKEFEHKRLTESILAQIVLKADEIDMQGDDQARKQRKALLNEAQEMLRKLDAAVGKKN